MKIEFFNENMMGANAWPIAEELTEKLPLKKAALEMDKDE